MSPLGGPWDTGVVPITCPWCFKQVPGYAEDRAELARMRGQITAALRELERASDVRTNRTSIIGNTHILLQSALDGKNA